MTDVFISYSRKDIAFARLINEALQKSDVDTWVDWQKIPVGERFWNEICQAIENANVFMFIISQNSLGSKVCKDEINEALKNNKRIIPIIVDKLKAEAVQAFVPDLAQINWIVFERDHIFRLEENPQPSSEYPDDQLLALPRLPQFEEAFKKLSAAIHTDWEWVKYHTYLQVAALRWQANQQNASYLLQGTALGEAEERLIGVGKKEPQPTDLQKQFVGASRQEENRRHSEMLSLEQKARQRQRLALWILGVGLVVAVGLFIFGWNQRDQYLAETLVRATAQSNAEAAQSTAVSESKVRATAESDAVTAANGRATQQAIAETQRGVAVEQRNIALSRQLAAQAVNQVGDQNLGLGILLAIEANNQASTIDGRGSLLRLVEAEPRLSFIIHAHSDTVTKVAISPDGKQIASASADHTLGLWDYATGKLLTAFAGHTQSVNAVLFLPDGRLVSGGNDGQVILWNPASPSPLKSFPGPKDTIVNSLALSPDSALLAVAYNNSTVALYDTTTWLQNCTIQYAEPTATSIPTLAFMPDGSTLLVGENDDSLYRFNPASCRQSGFKLDDHVWLKNLDLPVGTQFGIYALAVRPDGKQLALGISDMLVVLDSDTFQPAWPSRPEVGNRPINAIRYSPDGSLIALALGDKTIHLLDSATGAEATSPLIGHGGAVADLAFASDGQSLISGGWDWAVYKWDLRNKPLAVTLTGAQAEVSSVAFSRDSRILAAGSWDKTIRLWDTSTWKEIGIPLAGHTDKVTVLAFSPTGMLLASGSSDKNIRLWDMSKMDMKGEILSGHTGSIVTMAFSPDGRWLASGAAGNELILWDIKTRQIVNKMNFANNAANISHDVNSVGFSADSQTLYFSLGDAKIDRVQVNDQGAGSDIQTFAWSELWSINKLLVGANPNGKNVVVINGVYVRLYDPALKAVQGLPLFGHQDLVTGAAFSPDGSLLATGSQDLTVRLWDTESRLLIGQPLVAGKKWVSSVAISPDGKWLAAGTGDWTAVVWDLDLKDWEAAGCSVIRRNMSASEWVQYLPDQPYHLTCPDSPVDTNAIKQITDLARTKTDQGNAPDAEAVLAQALKWIADTRDPAANNALCWFGSLDGFAAQVMPACDLAVSLTPPANMPGISDSRGLAEALVGKYQEAIADFEIFIEATKHNDQYDTAGKQRESWVTALNQGQNPFTPELLKELRSQ